MFLHLMHCVRRYLNTIPMEMVYIWRFIYVSVVVIFYQVIIIYRFLEISFHILTQEEPTKSNNSIVVWEWNGPKTNRCGFEWRVFNVVLIHILWTLLGRATTLYWNLKMYLCACKSCQVFCDSFLIHITHGMGGNYHACLSE